MVAFFRPRSIKTMVCDTRAHVDKVEPKCLTHFLALSLCLSIQVILTQDFITLFLWHHHIRWPQYFCTPNKILPSGYLFLAQCPPPLLFIVIWWPLGFVLFSADEKFFVPSKCDLFQLTHKLQTWRKGLLCSIPMHCM